MVTLREMERSALASALKGVSEEFPALLRTKMSKQSAGKTVMTFDSLVPDALMQTSENSPNWTLGEPQKLKKGN